MHFGIYDVFHSQNSHQHVSVGIPAFFMAIFLVQQYSCGELCRRHFKTIIIYWRWHSNIKY
jgi:hypothetical protein